MQTRGSYLSYHEQKNPVRGLVDFRAEQLS